MRRFLRLLTLWLLALALPIQGTAATAMRSHASSEVAVHTMALSDGASMQAPSPRTLPCHHQGVDKSSCGACCGPIAAQQALLAVVPVALRWAPAPHAASQAAPPLFLTGGTDRPPRHRTT